MQPPSIVITGASTGIGKACALHLSRAGFRVFAGVRREEDGERLRSESSEGITPIFVEVTDQGSIERAARAVDEAVGPDGLFGLVNNAGISVPGPLEILPIEGLRRQLDVNVVGQIAVIQSFAPLIRRARGRILLMGSILGRFALPFLGAYSAAKFALEALADSLSMELAGSGVSVSIIEPGSIATPIWTKTREGFLEMGQAHPEKAWADYWAELELFGKRMDRFASTGISPERVAAVVERALRSRRPRARYPVGRDSSIFGRLAPLLPGRLRQRIVRKDILRK